MTLRRTCIALFLAAGGPACARLYKMPIESCPVHRLASEQRKVSVRYLGFGGFLLKRGDDVVVTAPFYSNPSPLEIALNHQITPDLDMIDELTPPGMGQAKAILVGHSHYYRLMDVPYIALNRATRADIYGSRTTAHLLAPIASDLAKKTPPTRVVVVDDDAAFDRKIGRWHDLGSTLRIMAIRSEHAPLAALNLRVPLQPDLQVPVGLWRGTARSDSKELPTSASQWLEGTVYAFVIDFLNASGAPEFRVYYQDSGGGKPYGYVPDALLKERGIDLAVVSAFGAFGGRDHPEGILKNTRPRHVIVGQWENPFVTQKLASSMGAYYGFPGGNYGPTGTNEFLKRVRRGLPAGAEKPWTPCPTRSVIEFEVR